MKNDTEYTNEIVCPYCGNTFDDSWEIAGNSDGDISETDCGHCGKPFEFETHIRITYTTRKIAKAKKHTKYIILPTRK